MTAKQLATFTEEAHDLVAANDLEREAMLATLIAQSTVRPRR